MTAQLKSIENTTINRLSIIEDKMNEMQHGMSDKIKEEVGEIKPKIVDEIKDEIRATLLYSFLVLGYPVEIII
jgi:hypothetical protein